MSRRANGQSVEILQPAPGRFGVRGALTFSTARRAREAGLRAFSRNGNPVEVEVDLSEVGAADSAGLAVLLDWLSWAHQSGHALTFTGLPLSLRAVARISEVEPLINGKA